MTLRKGGDEPDVTIRILGTTVIVITALVMSQGMAEGAFGSISQMGNDDFIKENIIGNIKTACETDGKQNLPREGSYKFRMEGVEKVKTEFHNTIGSNYVQFKISYGGGSTESYKIDSKGYLASWKCSDASGDKKYRINGSTAGFNDEDGQVGTWVEINPDQPVKWRIMEKSADGPVNIEVVQD
jgi:hypothetical protein